MTEQRRAELELLSRLENLKDKLWNVSCEVLDAREDIDKVTHWLKYKGTLESGVKVMNQMETFKEINSKSRY